MSAVKEEFLASLAAFYSEVETIGGYDSFSCHKIIGHVEAECASPPVGPSMSRLPLRSGTRSGSGGSDGSDGYLLVYAMRTWPSCRSGAETHKSYGTASWG